MVGSSLPCLHLVFLALGKVCYQVEEFCSERDLWEEESCSDSEPLGSSPSCSTGLSNCEGIS